MPQTLEEVVKTLSKYVTPTAPVIDKARTIYEWMIKNIAYDTERKLAIDDGLDKGTPRSPEYTLKCRKGVCSDMTLLYIEIARRMRIKADYAHVSVDFKDISVSHACAIVDTLERKIQVDVAYQIFGASHKDFQIINPHTKVDFDLIRRLPKRKILRLVFAAGALISGIMAYLNGEFSSSLKKEKICMLESGSGANFVSNSGVLRFSYGREAESALKEYVFFIEAKEGRLSDGKMFEKYLSIDANKDGAISFEEAAEAKKSAREKYFGKNSN